MNRSEIYLKAHSVLKKHRGSLTAFLCILVNEANKWNCAVNKHTFPELFLFRHSKNDAWLSFQFHKQHNSQWSEEEKQMKLTVLEFCIEIAKSNGN